MNSSKSGDRPGIIAPPPLMALLAILAGLAADHFLPLALVRNQATLRVACGVALLVLAGSVFLLAVRELRAHGTTPNPYQPSTTVVSSGVYRFSRNPIYVSFLLIVLAAGLGANTAWIPALAVALFLLLHFGVVKREERYLSAKFGAPYDDYRRAVRRWL